MFYKVCLKCAFKKIILVTQIMVSKEQILQLDLQAFNDAINKTMQSNMRSITRSDFNTLLTGKETCGYNFSGQAVHKTISKSNVGCIRVTDQETQNEGWFGIVDKQIEVFHAKSLNVLEWKIGLALKD